MAMVFGVEYGRGELLRRVGNVAQVAGAREYTYSSGRADGVRAVEVNSGEFRFEVLASRCLDIASASFKGIPLGYHSKSGVRHPAYFAKNDPTGFQDNFLGGLLTTCGLHNIGPAAEGGGRPHQLHGELANMPAEKVGVAERWEGDELVFTVSGEVRHSSFYHEDLVLRRRISSRVGANRIDIDDEVENLDFAPAPCLALYHVQFGFPLLGERSRLLLSPSIGMEPRTEAAGAADPERFGPPGDGADEACYYRSLRANAAGWATACLFNPDLGPRGMGGYVRYRTDTLPLLVQWRMLRSREYVCGLEPASARLDDRDAGAVAADALRPLETRRYRLELGVIEGEEAFSALLERGADND